MVLDLKKQRHKLNAYDAVFLVPTLTPLDIQSKPLSLSQTPGPLELAYSISRIDRTD
jgi:hypothetical protein